MVTIGMNYEVLEGKQHAFESKFALVVEAMAAQEGHVRTQLYAAIDSPRSYLVVSHWDSSSAFDAFVSSEEFARVTRWGRENILASRPSHHVYGASEPLEHAAPARCPVAAHG